MNELGWIVVVAIAAVGPNLAALAAVFSHQNAAYAARRDLVAAWEATGQVWSEWAWIRQALGYGKPSPLPFPEQLRLSLEPCKSAELFGFAVAPMIPCIAAASLHAHGALTTWAAWALYMTALAGGAWVFANMRGLADGLRGAEDSALRDARSLSAVRTACRGALPSLRSRNSRESEELRREMEDLITNGGTSPVWEELS